MSNFSNGREIVYLYRCAIVFLFNKDTYGSFLDETARSDDLHPAAEDILLVRRFLVCAGATSFIDVLVLRQRAETVAPLHAAGSVGLLRLAAMKVLEAQAASNRLQTAVDRRREIAASLE